MLESSSCFQCGFGTYLASPTNCQPCIAGTYSNTLNASSCLDCNDGYTSAGGATVCVPAGFGRYSDTVTHIASDCPVGTFSNIQTASDCIQGTSVSYFDFACTECSLIAFSQDPTLNPANVGCLLSSNTAMSKSTYCPSIQFANSLKFGTDLVCLGGTDPSLVSPIKYIYTGPNDSSGYPTMYAPRYTPNTDFPIYVLNCELLYGTNPFPTPPAFDPKFTGTLSLIAPTLTSCASNLCAFSSTNTNFAYFSIQPPAGAVSLTLNFNSVNAEIIIVYIIIQPLTVLQISTTGDISLKNIAFRLSANVEFTGSMPYPIFSLPEDNVKVTFSSTAVVYDGQIMSNQIVTSGNNILFGTSRYFYFQIASIPGERLVAGVVSDCPAGTFSQETNVSVCTPCPIGTNSMPGAVVCTTCPVGNYIDASQTCVPCSPGTFNATPSSTSCSPCPDGNISAAGAAACSPVGFGRYSDPLTHIGYDCPPGTFSNIQTASVCQDGIGEFFIETDFEFLRSSLIGQSLTTSADPTVSSCYLPNPTSISNTIYCPSIGLGSNVNIGTSLSCSGSTPALISTIRYNYFGSILPTLGAGRYVAYSVAPVVVDGCQRVLQNNPVKNHPIISDKFFYTIGLTANRVNIVQSAGVFHFTTTLTEFVVFQVLPTSPSVVFDFSAVTTNTIVVYHIPSNQFVVTITTIGSAGKNIVLYPNDDVTYGGSLELPVINNVNAGDRIIFNGNNETHRGQIIGARIISSGTGNTFDTQNYFYYVFVSVPGQKIENSVAVDCPINTFTREPNSITCTPCPANTTAPPKSFACNACGIGSTMVGPDCEICVPGTFKTSTSPTTPCLPCADGRTSGYAATACVAVGPGRYSDPITHVAFDCPPGTYNPSSLASSCLTCPTGTTSPAGAIACSACGVGNIPNPSTFVCEPCPANTYQPLDAGNTCIPCDPGEISLPGSGGCGICVAGYEYDADDNQCLPCDYGSYSSYLTDFICVPCPEGTKANALAAAISCIDCGAGYFSREGSVSCDICLAGTFSTGPRSKKCTYCAPGQYQILLGQSACVTCPSSYSSAVGSAICSACTAGQRIVGGLCQDCPVGQFQPNPLQTGCIACSPKSYAPITGLPFCLPCGTAATSGQSVCTEPESTRDHPEL